MLRHCLASKWQLRGQGRWRDLTVLQHQVEHAAPRAVGNRLEEQLLVDPRPRHLKLGA